jgi:hypothetical protein
MDTAEANKKAARTRGVIAKRFMAPSRASPRCHPLPAAGLAFRNGQEPIGWQSLLIDSRHIAHELDCRLTR